MWLEKLFQIPYSLRLTKGGIYLRGSGTFFHFLPFDWALFQRILYGN